MWRPWEEYGDNIHDDHVCCGSTFLYRQHYLQGCQELLTGSFLAGRDRDRTCFFGI